MEGELLKQNMLTFAWRMRYFSLEGTELVMFDKQGGKEKGRISLGHGEIDVEPSTDNSKPHSVSIFDPGKKIKWILAAEDDDIYDDWTDALGDAISAGGDEDKGGVDGNEAEAGAGAEVGGKKLFGEETTRQMMQLEEGNLDRSFISRLGSRLLSFAGHHKGANESDDQEGGDGAGAASEEPLAKPTMMERLRSMSSQKSSVGKERSISLAVKADTRQTEPKAPPAGKKRKAGKLVVCVFCNQKCGFASIGFHEKSCEKRREDEQLTLPVTLRMELELSALPPKPSGDDGFAQYKAYNEAAVSIFTGTTLHHTQHTPYVIRHTPYAIRHTLTLSVFTAAMPSCPRCARTFFTDRLQKHMKTCCADYEDGKQYIVCVYCNVKQPQSLLSLHEGGCRYSPPYTIHHTPYTIHYTL
jgi:hypothetical protein